MSWWKNAFSMGPEREFKPTPRQNELVDRLAAKVVEREMTVPAVLFLETVKPLNYVGSQVLVFLGPLARTLFAPGDYDEIARFLENRRGIEILIERIEAKAAERDASRRADRARGADEASREEAPPTGTPHPLAPGEDAPRVSDAPGGSDAPRASDAPPAPDAPEHDDDGPPAGGASAGNG